jgi:predicted nucleic acid-binding protein
VSAYLLDASVVLAALDRVDVNHERSSALLGDEERDLATLDLARYEVANVAVTLWHELGTAARALAVLETMGGRDGLVRSDMKLLVAASEIAARNSISVYDASYVAAAQATDRQLVSCDQRDLVSRGLAIHPAEIV